MGLSVITYSECLGTPPVWQNWGCPFRTKPEDRHDTEDPNDSEDDNYLPPVEEEDDLEAEDFTVPDNLADQERFRRQLLATSRRLKAK